MPKYGIHGIVLSKARDDLANGSSSDIQASNVLRDHVRLAMMGSVGPDIFFWADDYEAVRVLVKLYENIGKIVDVYNDVTQPVRAVTNAVGTASEAVVGTLAPHTVELVRQLLERLSDTADLFKSALTTNLFAGVLSIGDWTTRAVDLPPLTTQLFEQFVPPMQRQMESHRNHDVSKWYWFDMLHYRRTGDFAHALLDGAGNDRQLQAFAYGYLSHIATDVTGHAYINQVVSSPYRLNVQRHAVVENFLDTWAYDHYYNASVSRDLLRYMPFPEPSSVPGNLWNLLHDSFTSTYAAAHPTRLSGSGYLSPEQIAKSYSTFYDVLMLMEKMIVERPEEPFSGVADVLANALADLLEEPPSPPSPSSACSWRDILSFGTTSSSQDCYEQFFEELAEWAEYMGELLLWTFETLQDLLDLLLALLLALPITALLAMLYAIQLLLYDVYQQARYMLATLGFVSPEPSDLNNRIGQNQTTTVLGCGVPFKFPRGRDITKSQLICGTRGIEQPVTSPANYSRSVDVNPSSFIDARPLDLAALNDYSNATDPGQTRELQSQGKDMGSAVAVATWMISNAATTPGSSAAYTNWNLDADRGYGYKTWDGYQLTNEYRIAESPGYVS